MAAADDAFLDQQWAAVRERIVFARNTALAAQITATQCFCPAQATTAVRGEVGHTEACALWETVSVLAGFVVTAAEECLADLKSEPKRAALQELTMEWQRTVGVATEAYYRETGRDTPPGL